MKTKVLQKILSFARFDDEVVVFKHKAVVQNAPFESTGSGARSMYTTNYCFKALALEACEQAVRFFRKYREGEKYAVQIQIMMDEIEAAQQQEGGQQKCLTSWN